MSLFSFRDVAFSYPGKHDVLRDLTFDVEEGSITAILGPNGAGKTTVLDLCLGWKRPKRGIILLRGAPLGALSRNERGRTMSLVPQRENVRFDFSVFEYVLLGRAPHLHPLQAPGKEDRTIAAEALEEAGISALSGRSITGLSGGEYQLMLIARSLAQRPTILLLDEPASQLDPGNQLLITRLLRRLSRKGITVLYSSHNPQTAATTANTIHLLKDGRFMYSGPPGKTLTEEALQKVYGVPFRITWIGRSLHLDWDREAEP